MIVLYPQPEFTFLEVKAVFSTTSGVSLTPATGQDIHKELYTD